MTPLPVDIVVGQVAGIHWRLVAAHNAPEGKAAR
jgi:hypothetical protein